MGIIKKYTIGNKVDVQDERFKILEEFNKRLIDRLQIEIVNTKNQQSFIRQIDDVTYLDNYIIISWGFSNQI